MPELPDIEVYLACLAPRVLGRELTRLVVRNPFVLRSVSPSSAEIAGTRVVGLRRMGKRIVFALEGDRFIVIHLMIAGRLRWHPGTGKLPGKNALAVLEFPDSRRTLVPGDWVDIPAHVRHRVAWTTPDEDTIWLAVFYR